MTEQVSAGYPVTQDDRTWFASQLSGMQDRINRMTSYVQNQVATAGALVPLRFSEAIITPTSTGSAAFTEDGALEFTDIETLSMPDLFVPGYRSYRMLMEVSTSALVFMFGRFVARNGGIYTSTSSDNTPHVSFSTGPVQHQAGHTAVDYWLFARSPANGGAATSRTFVVADIQGPQEAVTKRALIRCVGSDGALLANGARRNALTLYDGLRFTISSGTMTGRLRLFGVKA